jgi:hypothetical protein
MCGSVRCDENDCPIEKHVTFEFPWDIETVPVELDAVARVKFKYVTAPRYKRHRATLGLTLAIGQTVSTDASVGCEDLPSLPFRTKDPRGI